MRNKGKETNAPSRMNKNTHRPRRLARVEDLRLNLRNHFDPVPTRDSFLRWLRLGGIPVVKANPDAAKGGGPCWVDARLVEEFLTAKFGVQLARKNGGKEVA